MLLQQSPERDANGRPIRTSRRQTVDLKVLLADDDDDDDDSDCVDRDYRNVDDSDKDDDDSEGNNEDKDDDHNDEDVEPPKKRIKLNPAENEDEQVESNPTDISNDSSDVKKSADSVSPQTHRRKKISYRKPKCDDDDDDDGDDVEKWAKAIIKYHQQSEDLRIR